MVWQRDNQFCRTRNGEAGGVQEGLPVYYLNHSNRPVRTRMPGGVGGAQLIMAAPYPDYRYCWDSLPEQLGDQFVTKLWLLRD